MTETDGQAAWDTLLASPADINPLMLEEIIFPLEELIFGANMIGLNAYYLLRRLMCDYKVDTNSQVKEWQWPMTQLNNYIMYLPSETLENSGAVKQEFTEIEGAHKICAPPPHDVKSKNKHIFMAAGGAHFLAMQCTP